MMRVLLAGSVYYGVGMRPAYDETPRRGNRPTSGLAAAAKEKKLVPHDASESMHNRIQRSNRGLANRDKSVTGSSTSEHHGPAPDLASAPDQRHSRNMGTCSRSEETDSSSDRSCMAGTAPWLLSTVAVTETATAAGD